MIKKILAAIAIIGTAINTTAQSNYAVPFVDTSRPENVIEGSVNIGVGASSMIQNYRSAVPGLSDFTFSPGTMMSVGADVQLPIRNFLAIGTSLNFNINNYSWAMTIMQPQDGSLSVLKTKNHFYDIDVPVYVAFRFNLSPKVRWTNEAGWYISFGAGGDTRTRVYTSATDPEGENQISVTHYKRDYYKDDNAIVNGVTSTDWGLHLATGLQICKRLSLKAVMHVGARDLSRNIGGLNINNHTLNASFKAGYIF